MSDTIVNPYGPNKPTQDYTSPESKKPFSSGSTGPSSARDTTSPDLGFIPITLDGEVFDSRKTYDANSQSPFLAPPTAGQAQPNSLDQASREAVGRFFMEEVQKELAQQGYSSKEIKKALRALVYPDEHPLAKGPLKQALQQARKKAIETTINYCRLPSSWTPESKNPSHWVSLPLTPYTPEEQKEIIEFYDNTEEELLAFLVDSSQPPLSKDQVDKLKSALQTGIADSTVKTEYELIVRQATALTQEEFGLPATWSKGATEPEEWTPIHLGPLGIKGKIAANINLVAENALQLANNFKKAVEKSTAGIDPKSEEGLAVSTMLELIFSITRLLRETQLDVQKSEDKIARGKMEQKSELLEDKKALQEKELHAMRKAQAKQRTMGSLGLVMKIVGPIVAALSTVAGTLLTVATLGLGSPAGLAIAAVGIAVGIAMMSYSVVDSVAGVSGKLFQAVAEALKDMMPNSSEAMRALVKALIVVAIVVVIVALVVATRGSALTSVASTSATAGEQAAVQGLKAAVNQLTSQMMKEIGKQTVRQLATQLAILLLAGSNAIPELGGAVAKELAPNSKEAQQAVEIVLAVIQMIGAMLFAASVVKDSMGAFTRVTVDSSQQATEQASRSIREIAEEILHAAQKQLLQTAEGMKEIIQKMKNLPVSLQQRFINAIFGYKDLFSNITKQESYMALASTFFSSVDPAVRTTAGVANGLMLMELYKAQMAAGEAKKGLEILQALINLIDQIINDLLEGLNRVQQTNDKIAKNFLDSVRGYVESTSTHTPV